MPSVGGFDASVVGNTRFNDTFEFRCLSGYVDGGSSNEGDDGKSVRCLENGRWNLGNLRCTGNMFVQVISCCTGNVMLLQVVCYFYSE